MLKSTLTLTIALACIMMFADGVQPNGSGTYSDPYLMESLDNLLWLSTSKDVWGDSLHFQQTCDIDASDTEYWNDGAGFLPIGTEDNIFKGVYDGAGHEIGNLHIDRPNQEYVGLWGYARLSSFSNLSLIDPSITGGDYTGAIAGHIERGELFDHCESSGSIEGSEYVGGLIGRTIYDTWDMGYTFISNCSSTCMVTGDNFVGGITGLANLVKVSYCTVNGEITATGERAGGIYGFALEASAHYCFVQGEISGANYVGGIVGMCDMTGIKLSGCDAAVHSTGDRSGGIAGYQGEGSDIARCYFTGTLSGTSGSGGIAGQSVNSFIYWCYVAGTITPSTASAFVGDFHPSTYGGRITYSVWNTQTTGVDHAMGTNPDSAIDCYGCTTAQMMQQSTYTDLGWDFVGETENGTDDNWDMSTDWNGGYPYIHDIWVYVDNEWQPNIVPIFSSALHNAYPNPFNPTTTISYSLAETGPIEISVYNLKGQKVRKLIDKRQTAGDYEVVWDGKNSSGRPVSSGVYFYRMSAPDRTLVKKMTMVK